MMEKEWQVPERIQSLDWGPAGLLVQTSEQTLYSADGKVITKNKIKGDRVVLSPNGRYLAAYTRNGNIEVRHAATGKSVARGARRGDFRNIAFTPNSASVVVVSDYGFDVGIWRFDPGGAYAVLEPESGATQIWFPEDSRELRASNGQGTAIWRLPLNGSYSAPVLLESTLGTDNRRQLPIPRTPPDTDGGRKVLAEAVGQSGRRAMIVAGQITRAGFQRTLESWEDGVKLAEQPYEPVLDRDRETFLQFTGRDRFLVIGTRTGLEMVEAKTLAPVTTLYHTGAILAAAQADGRRAATMDRNGSIRVWDIANGREISRLAAENGAQMLALGNNGRWLATLTGSGKIELWAIAADELIAQTCHWLEKPCP
jgi:WD40 repeat protein